LAGHGRRPRRGRRLCIDEFGPLQVKPQPGVCWAPQGEPDRLRATYRRTQGIGYLFGSYDLEDDLLHGRNRRSRTGADFLGFLTELRGLYPLDERLDCVVDNLSTHTTADVQAWLPDNNAEPVLLPTYSSWLNRIEGHFAAIHSFVIAGSDYPDHDTIEHTLLHYLDWRNQPRHDPKPRRAETRGCFHRRATSRLPGGRCRR
jgi:transposase